MIVDDTTNPAVPMTHARIGYDKIFGTITASSEANGFPATAADNPLTYTGWKPTALPATWQIDAGTAQDVDYVGIAAHTLGSSFCKVKVQYSDNGSDWLDASSPHRPNDDSPILFLFDEQEARYWRIYVNSTNLLLWSEEFDNPSWAVIRNTGAAIVTPNTDIAPDGTQTACTLTDDDTGLPSAEGLQASVTVTADTTVYCGSLFVKKDGVTSRFPALHLVAGAKRYRLTLNTKTGEVRSYGDAATAFGVQDCGDYWRIYVAGPNDGVGTTVQFEIYPAALTDFNGPDDGAAATGSIVAWGAQLEAGSFPTSYIKTEGSTSPSDIPFVGVIYIGKALAMQRAIYGGHSPVTLSRETTIRPTVSERGQWLGRSIIRGGLVGSWTWRHLNADWYREHFDRFVKAARERPFFIAWRPETFPTEVAYCWTQKDIVPSNMGIKDFMQVTVEAVGVE